MWNLTNVEEALHVVRRPPSRRRRRRHRLMFHKILLSSNVTQSDEHKVLNFPTNTFEKNAQFCLIKCIPLKT